MSSLIATSSRVRLPLRALSRSYAASAGGPSAGEGKLEVIRGALYPADSVSPTSASPVGARHPNYAARVRAAIPSSEAHATIERAWALRRRDERAARTSALRAKYDAMVEACDELDALTRDAPPELAGAAPQDGGPGPLPRAMYDRAMIRMAHGSAAYAAAQQGLAQGKKKTPESRFIEGRPEGLVPREAWVPVETRGKGWDYAWERPPNEW